MQYKQCTSLLSFLAFPAVLQPAALEEVRLTQGFDALPSRHAAISRYMATNSGVFRITPGMILSTGYDATAEPWYKMSTLYQDRCVFTRAGYGPTGDESLVSMSQTLLSAK